MVRFLVPAFMLLLCSCTAHQRERALAEPAPGPRAGGEAPRGRPLFEPVGQGLAAWRRYGVQGVEREGSLSLEGQALRLDCESAGAIFWLEAPDRRLLDPREEPVLSWRWRVSGHWDSSSREASRDNFPARVLVGFEAGWEGADAATLAWKRQVEERTGRTPPSRALCYTRGGALGPAIAVDAAWGMGRLVCINLRTPQAGTGWLTEARDLAQDYASIFGEAAPAVSAIAIACDTHLVKLSASAWFEDFTALSREQASMLAPAAAVLEREPSSLARWLVALAGAFAVICGAWLARVLSRRRPS